MWRRFLLGGVGGVVCCAFAAAGYLVANAAGYDQACFVVPPGGANRDPECIAPGAGCIQSDFCSGVCWVGEHAFPVLSCNQFAEWQYGRCQYFPDTWCRELGPRACLQFRGFMTQCIARVARAGFID